VAYTAILVRMDPDALKGQTMNTTHAPDPEPEREELSPVNIEQNRAAGQHSPAKGSRQGRTKAQDDKDAAEYTPDIGTNAAQIEEAGEPLPDTSGSPARSK